MLLLVEIFRSGRFYDFFFAPFPERVNASSIGGGLKGTDCLRKDGANEVSLYDEANPVHKAGPLFRRLLFRIV